MRTASRKRMTTTPDEPRWRTTVIDPAAAWVRAARVDGSIVALFLDASVPGADLYGGINTLAPGATIPLHSHSVGELQFILAGSGVTIHGDGGETPVEPHCVVFAPRGLDGAHGFRNTGSVPLRIVFVYPSPGGAVPDFNLVDASGGADAGPGRQSG